VSSEVVYADIGPEERALDWRVTTRIMSDGTLMKTLQDSQSGGVKHAVIARVEKGQLLEAYVSPEESVKKNFPFDPVARAFEAYHAGRGVCILIVRDNKAVISINSVR
jgi:DNA-directed RNA polymerase subunit H (RpoH/RPB5)